MPGGFGDSWILSKWMKNGTIYACVSLHSDKKTSERWIPEVIWNLSGYEIRRRTSTYGIKDISNHIFSVSIHLISSLSPQIKVDKNLRVTQLRGSVTYQIPIYDIESSVHYEIYQDKSELNWLFLLILNREIILKE